jgi:hypothetical protein
VSVAQAPVFEYDVWTCAECGQEYPFPRLVKGKRGGPLQRGLDRRYSPWYTCWRNKRCPSHKRKLAGNRIILVAPGAPNPEQPAQPGPIEYGPKQAKRRGAKGHKEGTKLA